MKRFKHVLVATDLSPESLSAVQYASHLASDDGAKLTIVHVPHSTALAFTEFTPPIDVVNIDATIEHDARERLQKWAKQHVRHGNTELIVRSGIIHETICKVAAEGGASVIVMATHGRKGLGRAVLGSVTERVLRDAPCPVLAIKPPKPAIRVSKSAK